MDESTRNSLLNRALLLEGTIKTLKTKAAKLYLEIVTNRTIDGMTTYTMTLRLLDEHQQELKQVKSFLE